jgi:hypothetical protein
MNLEEIDALGKLASRPENLGFQKKFGGVAEKWMSKVKQVKALSSKRSIELKLFAYLANSCYNTKIWNRTKLMSQGSKQFIARLPLTGGV